MRQKTQRNSVLIKEEKTSQVRLQEFVEIHTRKLRVIIRSASALLVLQLAAPSTMWERNVQERRVEDGAWYMVQKQHSRGGGGGVLDIRAWP